MNRNWPKEFPPVVASLDLDLPALIEASAGTGKTYAIEHLVLRLVAEKPDWKFESLLLLSFTDKTAGDLRKRVRDRLKKESQNTALWDAAERSRFIEAHLRFDEASIHTLHGFCHSVLRAHALENGTLFDSELAEEQILLESALDGLLRGPWTHDEARLRNLLEALGAGHGNWERRLVSIAMAYQPGRGDVLEPSPDPETLTRISEKFRDDSKSIETSFQRLQRGSFPFEDHRGSFGSSKTGHDNLRRDIFIRIEKMISSLLGLEDSEKTEAIRKFFLGLSGNLRAVQKGFSACIPPKAEKDPLWMELATLCQNLRKTVLEWKEAERQRSLGLIAEAVRELRERLAWEKRRHGALSYNDMVLRLVEAIRVRPSLVEHLRERYRACIVDEFQDTDPLQWDLLQRLCLQGTGGAEDTSRIPLFLVGDPKQAIYGFRGGDLQTYLGARALFHAESLKGRAQGEGLKENYRSEPELVHALNAVFVQSAWFNLSPSSESSSSWNLPGQSDHIPFTPVLLPPEKNRLLPGKARVVMKDFSASHGKSQGKSETQKSVHAWIASEIQKLAANASIRFSDVAILTRTNPEAAMAERSLRRMGIPCRVRRKGGLFEGVQADQIRLLLLLLESAADPKIQAQILLLPFLREEWPRGIPEECPVPIREWAALAAAGEWAEFFRALLYKSGYLYRLAAETRGGSETQNLLGLTRALTEEGLRQGYSLRGLLQRFDELRGGESGDSGETSGEATDERVTLMTLHMSKGLEFPVVFLASMSDGMRPAFYTLRGEKGFRHVLDKEDKDALQEYQQQSLEEDKRLFYVGLTRAQELLYVPLLPEKVSRTGYGSLGGFAAEALRAANGEHPELFQVDASSLPSIHRPSLPAQIPSLSPAIDISAASVKNAELLFPDKDPWEEAGAFFLDRRRKLSSYSQLLKREVATVLEEDGRRLNREEGEEEPAETGAAEIVSAAELPPGAGTGNALHELLENVDFGVVGRASDAESLLQDFQLLGTAQRILRGHNLSEEYAPAALRLVWKTLRMPIPDPAGGGMFELGSVLSRKHEMEFLFPFTGLSGSVFSDSELPAVLPEKTHPRNGFLWGFMDLIFRHEGRYYLLDWKSNLLERYNTRDIEAHMRAHHYDLQYQLYAVALDKWLSARLPEYEAEKDFGGVIYLYLRGASLQSFSGFTHRPGLKELREEYPARLRAALGLKLESRGALA